MSTHRQASTGRHHTARPYLVKEIFGPTLQGEGAHAGTPCVFLRFARCNLACSWCDTDFAAAGARRLDAGAIARELRATDTSGTRLVVVTGGEPTLQWDPTLAAVLRDTGFRVHMESNGTRPLRGPVDWLTVSPKPQFHRGHCDLEPADRLPVDECKVVVDDTVDAALLDHYMAHYRCQHWFLQPCADGADQRHLRRTLDLLRERPRWRLSLQLHKLLGLP